MKAWQRMRYIISFFVLVVIVIAPKAVHAQKFPERMDVTIFDEFNLHQKPDFTSKSDGTLSPIQTIKVKESDSDYPGWYVVETWLGDRWMFIPPHLLRLGTIETKDSYATLLTETDVFDRPLLAESAIFKLSPQKVHVTGAMPYCGWNVRDNCHLSWLRIDTWLGEEKWIAPDEYKELAQVTPLNDDFKLKYASELYLEPFRSQKTDAVLPAGEVVHLKGIFTYVPGRAGPVTWCQISLKDGDRWINDGANTFRGVLSAKETVKIDVPFHYYEEPNVETADKELHEPQTFTAFEKIGGDWFHVLTSSGSKWVYPFRAESERPPGIKESTVTVHVTPNSIVADYPFYDNLSIGKVVLEEQDIQSTHQYTSDISGRTWYRILTKEGYKWVDPQ